uniref:Transcription and mRNA export factor ENY2 n=1 Tax=Anas platyrhynchos TaxID=8839 RepID=A0A8B9QW13_ANAPL
PVRARRGGPGRPEEGSGRPPAAPPLTVGQPKAVAGQRLQGQLVALEAGLQQQPLGAQRAAGGGRHVGAARGPSAPPANSAAAAGHAGSCSSAPKAAAGRSPQPWSTPGAVGAQLGAAALTTFPSGPCEEGAGGERPARLGQLCTMNKDAQMRATINQKLIETGERERLKDLLRAKLIECGWKDQLKAHCKDVIKEKGLEHVTVDDLVAEITPKGRALVPDSVKKELLQRIRTFLAQHANL